MEQLAQTLAETRRQLDELNLGRDVAALLLHAADCFFSVASESDRREWAAVQFC